MHVSTQIHSTRRGPNGGRRGERAPGGIRPPLSPRRADLLRGAAESRVREESLRSIDVWLRRAEARPGLWLAALAALLALQIGPLWYATQDGVAYLSIARSIAGGGPVARLGDPQLGYPTGYPWLISPVLLAGPRPFLLLSLLHWLMAVAFMLGVYRWARAQIGAGAPWVTALVMANVHVWNLYRRTLSEAAFCAVLIWTITLLNGVIDSAADLGSRRGRRQLLLAGAALVILSTIREVGMLVGAGAALAVLARLPAGGLGWRAAARPLALTAAAIAFGLA